MPLRSYALALAAAACLLPAPARAALRVALLPIAVHAQAAETGYLSRGLAEMLAARLERYEDLVVIRPASDARPPARESDAVAAAREAGADFALFGSFTRFGDGASLDLRLAAVGDARHDDDDEGSGERARRVFIQAGTVAEIIPRLDTLAEKIARSAFRGEGATPPIAAAAPSEAGGDAGSDPALEELLRRVEALERAVYVPVATGDTRSSASPESGGDGRAVR